MDASEEFSMFEERTNYLDLITTESCEETFNTSLNDLEISMKLWDEFRQEIY